ncbi:hypothetical protein TRFO_07771 [Tritrichomonas foetus]|uniref:Uncharacterized protein n=1 Tax=Tritrichomonas foetus TaxID=1144522 RepID=A0A1J4JNR8_9EUKA|nr:hypothetical protein TRFO_07771 [Tritrichomonas foetus]|eukprot:OHT00791.1 hypothetical protein TRFO_07771 [Tritrichomonas foetus]
MPARRHSQPPKRVSEPKPDNLWFARLQEVLLMHRPVVFCILLAAVELIFGFVYFLNLGIFATIALLGLIAFMCFIHAEHPNPLFEKLFFPPLKQPIDPNQPNRIRSYEEFSTAMSSIHQGISHYLGNKHLTGIKRIIFGIGSFIFALLLKRVVPFWVNFLLVHCILFLPSAILRPWPTKEQQIEDAKPTVESSILKSSEDESGISSASASTENINDATSNQSEGQIIDQNHQSNNQTAAPQISSPTVPQTPEKATSPQAVPQIAGSPEQLRDPLQGEQPAPKQLRPRTRSAHIQANSPINLRPVNTAPQAKQSPQKPPEEAAKPQ